MKAKMYSVNGEEKGSVDLPMQFNEEVREDLIKRVFLSLQSNKRQKYGADPRSGKRQGKAFSKRRRKFGTTYGFGISRVKRKIFSARGTRFYRSAAFIASAVGGRKAHSPLSIKNISEKINKKERKKAIRSSISSSKFDNFPLIIDNKVETLNKTKDVKKLLESLGIEFDNSRKIKKGKGKLRGRKYKTKKSVLFVVSKKCELFNSAKNIAGADVSEVRNLNVELLAPGGSPGRLTIWSKDALENLEKKKLFA